MYCHNCGTTLRDLARFCTKCGTSQQDNAGVEDRPAVLPPVSAAPAVFAALLRSSLTLAELEAIIRTAPQALDVHADDDSVMFKFKDKDQDLMLIIATEIDQERIIAMMPMAVPEDRFIAALVAANSWNQMKTAHDTFAYVGAANGKYLLTLEAHLLLHGGVSTENIRAWIDNLIEHINPFETQMIEVVQKIGSDKEILKGGGGFWRNAGAFVGAALAGTFTVLNDLSE